MMRLESMKLGRSYKLTERIKKLLPDSVNECNPEWGFSGYASEYGKFYIGGFDIKYYAYRVNFTAGTVVKVREDTYEDIEKCRAKIKAAALKRATKENAAAVSSCFYKVEAFRHSMSGFKNKAAALLETATRVDIVYYNRRIEADIAYTVSTLVDCKKGILEMILSRAEGGDVIYSDNITVELDKLWVDFKVMNKFDGRINAILRGVETKNGIADLYFQFA